MTAVQVLAGTRPLGRIARPAGGALRVRRSVLLAGGGWLATAHSRVSQQLQAHTGPTRCSRVLVLSYPPHLVTETLAVVTHVEDVELAGAQLAAAADHCGGRPRLWLFVASCAVLWTQAGPVDAHQRGLS